MAEIMSINTTQQEEVKKVVLAFMRGWTALDHRGMWNQCTDTFKHTHPNPTQMASRIDLAALRPRIILMKQANRVMCDVLLSATIQGKRYRIYMRCIQEAAAYLASPSGKWGVNPVSIRLVSEKATLETAKP